MAESPTFAQILDRRGRSLRVALRLVEPCTVLAYDAAAASCSVRPMLMRSRLDEFGRTVTETAKPIHDVPVVFAGGGRFGESFPLEAGDVVAVAWCSRSLDRFLQSDGTADVDPEDERVNHVSDAIAYPGMYTFPAARRRRAQLPTPDRAVFGAIEPNDAGVAPRLEVDDAHVYLGGSTLAQPTVMADSYLGAESALLEALAAFVAAASAAAPTEAAAFATAYTAFQAAAAAFKTTIAKVR